MVSIIRTSTSTPKVRRVPANSLPSLPLRIAPTTSVGGGARRDQICYNCGLAGHLQRNCTYAGPPMGLAGGRIAPTYIPRAQPTASGGGSSATGASSKTGESAPRQAMPNQTFKTKCAYYGKDNHTAYQCFSKKNAEKRAREQTASQNVVSRGESLGDYLQSCQPMNHTYGARGGAKLQGLLSSYDTPNPWNYNL